MATRHSLPVRGITPCSCWEASRTNLPGGEAALDRVHCRLCWPAAQPGHRWGHVGHRLHCGPHLPFLTSARRGHCGDPVAGMDQSCPWLVQPLPGFPLDGGRVLRAVIWGLTGNYWLATNIAALLGQALAVALALGSVALFLRTGNFINLWPIMVGAFIFMAAGSARSAMREPPTALGCHRGAGGDRGRSAGRDGHR